MKEEAVNGEGYEEERHSERRTFWNLGKGEQLRGGTVFSVEGIFWFGFWVNYYRGAPGC